MSTGSKSSTPSKGVTKTNTGASAKGGPIWKTKWGARRVRKEPPTLEEALIAAEAFAPGAKAEVAAELMGVSVEEVKTLMQRLQTQSRGRATLVTGRSRAVVVEYKRPRTISRPLNSPMGRR